MHIKILTSLFVVAFGMTKAEIISAIPTTVTVTPPPAHATKLTVVPTLSIGGRASDVAQVETTPGLIATGITTAEATVPATPVVAPVVAAPVVAERLITTDRPIIAESVQPIKPTTVL